MVTSRLINNLGVASNKGATLSIQSLLGSKKTWPSSDLKSFSYSYGTKGSDYSNPIQEDKKVPFLKHDYLSNIPLINGPVVEFAYQGLDNDISSNSLQEGKKTRNLSGGESFESFALNEREYSFKEIKNNPSRPVLIVVDGLISSGKSTLLSNLKKKGFKVYPEPLPLWKEQLKKFYDNPQKEFLNMQRMVLKSQISLKESLLSSFPSSTNQNTNCQKRRAEYIFIERSHISQLYFIQTGVELGTISMEEACVFLKFWENTAWIPDITVHMDTPVTTCFERIQRRGQVGDNGVTFDYLELLNRSYSSVYSSLRGNPNYFYINQKPEHSVNDLLNLLTL